MIVCVGWDWLRFEASGRELRVDRARFHDLLFHYSLVILPVLGKIERTNHFRSARFHKLLLRDGLAIGTPAPPPDMRRA